ncbi:MAG: polysaccharide biosynthesis C-terminal domain-containing protein [Bacteroidales bacterium]|jgi:O-antigen/teichoic acid export membrane protein
MAKRVFFRDFVGVLNSNVVSLVGALLLIVVLTRILGTESFGRYNALIVIPLIVISFTHLGIRGASIYLLGSKKYDKDQLVSSVLIILIGSGTIGIVLSAFGFWIFQETTFNILLITMVLFIIPLKLATIYSGGIFYGNDEIKKANHLNWIINILNLLLVVLLVWWLDYGLTGAVVATLLANLYVAVKALRMLTRQFSVKLVFYPAIIKNLLRMGLIFSMSFFVLQLNYRIDILLLEKYSTIHEVGVYSLAAQIGEQLWQIPLAVSIVLFSRIANSNAKSTPSNILPLTRIVLLLVSVIGIGLFIIAPYLIPLFFGKDFSSSSLMLQIILPGIVAMSVFRVLSGQLAGLGKPHVTLYIFIPALLINISLNLLWIPQYGGKGAALASSASYFLGAIGYWIYYSYLHHQSLLEIVHFRKSDLNIVHHLLKKARKK